MAGAFNIASLRTSLLLEATRAPQPIASSSFSTSATILASRARRTLIKRKRNAHIAKRAAMDAETSAGRADPVYGHIVPDESASAASTAAARAAAQHNPWEGCRLQRTLLRPEQIWATATPDYASHGSPSRFLPGLTSDDQTVLFGTLPHVSSALKISGETRTGEQADAYAKSTIETQQKKVEMLQRILDLKNANKKGIEVYNRERVIAEFGTTEAQGGRERKGADTGSSQVQAALLTQKIRSLAEHLAANKRDIHNRRALRQLVHDRARILQYFRRSNSGKTKEEKEERYLQLLADLGLQRRAVEGEITL